MSFTTPSGPSNYPWYKDPIGSPKGTSSIGQCDLSSTHILALTPTPSTDPTISVSTSTSSVEAIRSKSNSYSPPKNSNAKGDYEAQLLMNEDNLSIKGSPSEQEEKKEVAAFLYRRGLFCDSSKGIRKGCVEDLIESEKARGLLLSIMGAVGDSDQSGKDSSSMLDNTILAMKRYFRQKNVTTFTENKDDSTSPFFYIRSQSQGNCFLVAGCLMLAYVLQHYQITGGAPIDGTKYIKHSFSDMQLYNYCMHDDGGYSESELRKMVKAIDNEFKVYEVILSINSAEFKAKITKLLNERGPLLLSSFVCHNHFCSFDPPNDSVGYVQFVGNPKNSKGKWIKLKENEYPQETTKIEVKCEDNTLPIDLVDSTKTEGTEVVLKLTGTEIKAKITAIFTKKKGGKKKTLPEKFLQFLSHGNKIGNKMKTRKMNKEKKKKRVEEELHAMIIIGCRFDENNNLFLLIQNSWDDMPLVEVSAEYLALCKAEIHAVYANGLDQRKWDEVKDNFFSVCKSRFADCNNLDRAENPKERGVYSS